ALVVVVASAAHLRMVGIATDAVLVSCFAVARADLRGGTAQLPEGLTGDVPAGRYRGERPPPVVGMKLGRAVGPQRHTQQVFIIPGQVRPSKDRHKRTFRDSRSRRKDGGGHGELLERRGGEAAAFDV